MKSLGAVCWGRGEPWVIEEIDVDPPGRKEVLVEWAAAGLCHSDEHNRTGDRVPVEMDGTVYPLLGGHEGAGIVKEIGPEVTEFVVGDHVVSSFVPACGRCRYCASGRAFICNANAGFGNKGQIVDGTIKHTVRGQELNVLGKLGTFSERTVVAEASLIGIDRKYSLESACLVSCGVATGWGSAVERGGTKPGDVVVVVGAGGLGNSAVQGARLVGAAHIVAIDPISYRREMAQKVGATATAPSIELARDLIMSLTDGQGADVVVLTPSIVTGDLIHEAIDVTGKGSVCVLTGMGPLGETPVLLDIGRFALFHKDLRGCLFGASDPRLAVPRLLNLYGAGLLDLDIMVSTYPLEDIGSALADSNEGRNVRGVLTMNR
jgi:NDMA-dependent alcohol dehydrogenase